MKNSLDQSSLRWSRTRPERPANFFWPAGRGLAGQPAPHAILCLRNSKSHFARNLLFTNLILIGRLGTKSDLLIEQLLIGEHYCIKCFSSKIRAGIRSVKICWTV